MNMLGRQIPLRTARVGGYFFVMNQDGTINASLDLSAYWEGGQTKAAVELPGSVDWVTKAMDSIKRAYKNNEYGCCVISSLFHIVGTWTGNDVGVALQGSDAEVMAAYRIWNPRGDNGCSIATVNNYWRDHGITINGQIHKIDGYVSVDNTNKDLVKAALALFGNIKLGIDLPQGWYDSKGEWNPSNGSTRIIGGHDVPALAYGDKILGFTGDGVVISTWAGIRLITWDAFLSTKWISEAYAVLGSADWAGVDDTAPNGFNTAVLKSDLQLLANGQIPSVGPPSVPLDWLI